MTTHSKPAFLAYLHSFRGFAIINIVAIHAIGFAIFAASAFNYDPKNPWGIANELLFHNSTIYFALISGLLFTAVLKRHGYKNFYLSKFNYVFLPYVFFTLLFSIFDGRANEMFVLHMGIDPYIKDLFRNFLYGKSNFVFWYIPVLFFLFLVTPLLDYIMHKQKWGQWLMAIIIAAPLLVRRVELEELWKGDFLSIQTMIYFMGAYAAGMYLADNLDERLEWVRKKSLLFIGLAVVSSAGILYAVYHSIDRIGEFSVLSTLYYTQKITISGLILVFFKKWGEQQPRWLHTVAKYSFTIYFLHVLFLGLGMSLLMPLLSFQKIAPLNLILGALILISICIILSMLVGWIFHKLFGKYSRMIVGS